MSESPQTIHVKRRPRSPDNVPPAVAKVLRDLLAGREVDVTRLGLDGAIMLAKIGRAVQRGEIELPDDPSETQPAHPQLPTCPI